MSAVPQGYVAPRKHLALIVTDRSEPCPGISEVYDADVWLERVGDQVVVRTSHSPYLRAGSVLRGG